MIALRNGRPGISIWQGAPEFVSLLEDLVPFNSVLLRQETRDLVLLESQRRVHRITQQDGAIVRRI